MDQWKGLRNEQYAELSQKHAMEGKRCIISHMVTNFYSILRQEENMSIVEQAKFQSVIGSLLHFSLRTRPDILAAVTILARYTAQPTRDCQIALYRLLQYLRTTKNMSLR